MSFVHYALVGHFDPAALFPLGPFVPARPLDPKVVERLLATYPPGVRDHVSFEDGCLWAQWAPCAPPDLSRAVRRFAYDLAERENCVAAESNPGFAITYPAHARDVQAAAWKRKQAEQETAEAASD